MLSEPLLVATRPPTKRSSAAWLALMATVILTTVVVYSDHAHSSTADVALPEHQVIVLDTNEVASGSFVIPPPCLYEMAGVALAGTTLLVCVVEIVPALGFAEGGVEAESAAAAWQATMGDVEKESLFATLQSLAARGELLAILKEGLPVVGGLAIASGAFCSKLDEIIKSTEGAAQALDKMTREATAQIERAAEDSGAIDQVRNAADGAGEALKDAAGKAKDAVEKAKDAVEKAWPWA